MFTKLREPFGKAGLTVGVIALVMATIGGAYAAGALSGKQKKEVEKIAKKYAGKPGAPGANGSNGANGKDGVAGTNGVGATTSPASEAECEEGGLKVTAANGSGAVCNGEQGIQGKPGKDGNPWTVGGTLPPEATETGTWAAGNGSGESGQLLVPISFTIPLAGQQCETSPGVFEEDGLCADQVHLIKVGQTPPSGCTGGTAGTPSAEPGNLCIYVANEEEVPLIVFSNPGVGSAGTAAPSGILLVVVLGDTTIGHAFGTWALTAPEAT